MNALPIGWKRPRYSYQEALRIVAWNRYGASHPGTDDKVSREARWAADRDLRPLLRSDPRPPPPPAPQGVNWVTGRPRSGKPVALAPAATWVDGADLEALCPGIFETVSIPPEQPKRTRTGTARHDRLDEALRTARDALKAKLGREPTAREVFAKIEYDPTGAVVDCTDERVTWADAAGEFHDSTVKAIANRLTRIRKG